MASHCPLHPSRHYASVECFGEAAQGATDADCLPCAQGGRQIRSRTRHANYCYDQLLADAAAQRHVTSLRTLSDHCRDPRQTAINTSRIGFVSASRGTKVVYRENNIQNQAGEVVAKQFRVQMSVARSGQTKSTANLGKPFPARPAAPCSISPLSPRRQQAPPGTFVAFHAKMESGSSRL